MLNFDEDRFLRIQAGALGLADGLGAAVAAHLDAGAPNLFFAGAGGAGILMHPAARLLQTRSAFPTHVELPAELVVTGSAHLREGSLVVIPSLSGTTPESVAALEYCRARGATVVALTGHADTPLAAGADLAFVNFAEDDTSCESFYLQSLVLALAVLRHGGELAAADHDRALAELATLPGLLLELKRGFEDRAARLAAAFRDEPYHVVTGAGSTWPQAFYYGMCILEEMQWIRTRPVHASDFFHGTLELVERGVSLVLLKGEDDARPLVDRVEKFATGHTDKVTVLDTAELPLPGISPDVRRMVSHVVLATLLERLSAHLEVQRDHPLTTRRYYRRVAY